MKDRDASDANIEFARLMARPDPYREQIAKLRADTQRTEQWNRWVIPMSAISLCFTGITLFLVGVF